MLSPIFFLLLSLMQLSHAANLPLWEAGAGMLNFRADHYRGSPGNKWYFLPVPALTVRGKNIESDSGFVRGRLLSFDNITFDLSFGLGLNTNSKDSEPRNGMSDLDPTVELGPMIRYYMWKSRDENHFINIEIPYRAVYATDLSYVDHVGYYAIPYINYISKATPQSFGWTMEISLGPQWGSTEFHDRFFGVNQEFVRPGRPFYRARSGYSGTQFSAVFSKRYKDLLFIPFVRWDYMDGAVFNDSPLYKNPNYVIAGMAVVWFFAKSSKLQKAPTMVK